MKMVAHCLFCTRVYDWFNRFIYSPLVIKWQWKTFTRESNIEKDPQILGKTPNVTCKMLVEELQYRIIKKITEFYVYGLSIVFKLLLFKLYVLAYHAPSQKKFSDHRKLDHSILIVYYQIYLLYLGSCGFFLFPKLGKRNSFSLYRVPRNCSNEKGELTCWRCRI